MYELGLGERLLGDNGLDSFFYESSWVSSFSFDYEAGATVFVTPVIVCNCPSGTNKKLFFSSNTENWYTVEQNIKNYILFADSISGLNTIYVKIVLESTQKNISPEINELSFIIHQETSLYTIATQVLADGLTPVNATWNIDERLQSYLIPYSWLSKMTHRKALSKITEACGGSAFQDRYGVVQVQSGQFINGTISEIGSVRTISDEEIYKSDSPVLDVSNSISVTTKPYKAGFVQVVWKTTSAQNLSSGEVKIFHATYSGFDAAIEAVTTLTGANATITDENYYYSGADIEVTATADTSITLSISAKPLEVVGSVIKTETDGESIRRYGVKAYNIDDNLLIQSEEIAELVAESIINITKNTKRSIEINWRGDPRIELGDCGTVSEQDAIFVSISHDYDGYYEQTAKLRRV